MGRTVVKSSRNASVTEFNCDTVEDFLDTISPNGSVLTKFRTLHQPCIFRGVSSCEYLLIPSALRNNVGSWTDFEGVNGIDNFQGQLFWEQTLLRSFFQVADAHGLQIPEDNQILRNTVSQIATHEYVYKILENKEMWPPNELLSLIGLAQHFGLPTRLLDWSRNPFIAAYFAASGVVESLSPEDRSIAYLGARYDPEPAIEGRLAVWVMNLSTRKQMLSSVSEGRRTPIDDVVLVSSPAALNARLHAQEALFSLYRPRKIDLERPVHNVPLDDYIQDPLPHNTEDSQLFWLVTLPKSQAKTLLAMLVRLGFTPAKIYPGFEGVVHALRQYDHSDTMNTNWFNLAVLHERKRI